ncbi:hypothetical protein FI667_g12490, partial [Globisporangium splendens]
MSKTRSTDPSPFNSAASTPSSASGADSASFLGALSAGPNPTDAAAASTTMGSFAPVAAVAPSQQHRYEQPRVRMTDRHPGVAYPGPPPQVDQPPRGYYAREPQPHSSSEMYQDQLELDDSILAETMSMAFKQMVVEQDCCFIAKGICHMCGTNERHLIPVVNFCPEFHVNHSLCREHLRSMHRVRMEDIFAGKNRPTVSKRSLKCMVCSRSCPCSTCQLEKQHEISRYKRWLAGEREYGLDSEDQSMGRDRDHHHMRAASLSKKPHRTAVPTGSENLADPSRQHSRDHHHHQVPPQPPRRSVHKVPMYQAPPLPHVDLSRGEEPRLLPSLQASAKPPSHSNTYRTAKRAAKEVTLGHLDTSRTSSLDAVHAVKDQPSPLNPSPHVGEPVESPSASYVMNCAESEKSLVRLLSSLHQEVTPSSVRYPSEPKQPRSFPEPPHSSPTGNSTAQGPYRTPSPYDGESIPLHPEQELSGSSNPGRRTMESGAERSRGKRTFARSDEEEVATALYDNAASLGDVYNGAGSYPSEASNRAQKRKRDGNEGSRTGSETSDTSVAPSKRGSSSGAGGAREQIKAGKTVHADAPRKSQGNDRTGTESFNARKVPTGALQTSERGSDKPRKPSPTAKGKAKDSGQRKKDASVPRGVSPTTAGRKRKGESSRASSASADRKSPVARKRAATTPKNKSASSKDGRGSKKQSAQEYVEAEGEEDDGDESEIDTNLDYCEVCLAAGDLVCCDVCPRSFHLACLKMKESDLPEGDWQCAECRKPSYFVKFRATVHMKQSVYGKCVETIRCLKSHPYAKQFLSPVTNVEHYRNIVKEPMDLSTIEAKLKSDKYAKSADSTQKEENGRAVNIDAFAYDVRLVWSNCKLFNDDGSGITRAADELAAGFEGIYKDLQDYVKSQSAVKVVNTSSSNATEPSCVKNAVSSQGPRAKLSTASTSSTSNPASAPTLPAKGSSTKVALPSPPIQAASRKEPAAKDAAVQSSAAPQAKPARETQSSGPPAPSAQKPSAATRPRVTEPAKKPEAATTPAADISSAVSVEEDGARLAESKDTAQDEPSKP